MNIPVAELLLKRSDDVVFVMLVQCGNHIVALRVNYFFLAAFLAAFFGAVATSAPIFLTLEM
jgi:hypothetical protein